VPKALVIDDDSHRRRGRSQKAETNFDSERNLFLRVVLHSPRDTFAGCVALAGVIAIIANATFMQAGRHPAPMFNRAFPETSVVSGPPLDATPSNPLPRPRPSIPDQKLSELKPAEPVSPALKAPVSQGVASAVARPPASVPTHNDPVGDMIQSTRRVAAVQQALTDYGYGQLKPTGVAGTDTLAAVQKFERDRKLPVTGRISDQLVRELSAATGRTID
jgi:hypothetical protein